MASRGGARRRRQRPSSAPAAPRADAGVWRYGGLIAPQQPKPGAANMLADWSKDNPLDVSRIALKQRDASMVMGEAVMPSAASLVVRRQRPASASALQSKHAPPPRRAVPGAQRVQGAGWVLSLIHI